MPRPSPPPVPSEPPSIADHAQAPKVRHVVGNAAERSRPETTEPADGSSGNGGDWLAEVTEPAGRTSK